jgi:hypothetical protein
MFESTCETPSIVYYFKYVRTGTNVTKISTFLAKSNKPIEKSDSSRRIGFPGLMTTDSNTSFLRYSKLSKVFEKNMLNK